MMSVLEWLGIIATTILVVALVYIALKGKIRTFIMPSYIKSHKRAEIRLLDNIIKDMKTNPSEWVATPYDMNSLRPPHFVNDKKNIAVVVGEYKTHVVIKINIESAHKYREHSEDTIATPITGDHVAKFLRNAEECIDTRGKELSFVEKSLKNRL